MVKLPIVLVLFPFLIGRIRTRFSVYLIPQIPWFPFLIGRIRTISKRNRNKEVIVEFPFLIGRIRTGVSKEFRKDMEGFHSS